VFCYHSPKSSIQCFLDKVLTKKNWTKASNIHIQLWVNMEKSGELVNFTLIFLSMNITNFLQNKQWSSNIEQGKISSMFVVLVVIYLHFLQPLARMSWFICCFPVCLSKLSHLSMMCMAWHVMTSHTMHLTNTKMPSPISNSTQANWVAQLSCHFWTTL